MAKRELVVTSADKTCWFKRMNHGLNRGFGYCTYRAIVPYQLFLCILGMDKTSDPSLVGRELSGKLYRQTKEEIANRIWMNIKDRMINGVAKY